MPRPRRRVLLRPPGGGRGRQRGRQGAEAGRGSLHRMQGEALDITSATTAATTATVTATTATTKILTILSCDFLCKKRTKYFFLRKKL